MADVENELLDYDEDEQTTEATGEFYVARPQIRRWYPLPYSPVGQW